MNTEAIACSILQGFANAWCIMDATHLIEMQLWPKPIINWAEKDIGAEGIRFSTIDAVATAFYNFLSANGFPKERISEYILELQFDDVIPYENPFLIRLSGSGPHFKEFCKLLGNTLSDQAMVRRRKEAKRWKSRVALSVMLLVGVILLAFWFFGPDSLRPFWVLLLDRLHW